MKFIVVFVFCYMGPVYSVDDGNMNPDIQFPAGDAVSHCNPFRPPPLPNFRAPGRRISEVKCYEYLWHLKTRADRAQHDFECEEFVTLNVVGGHATNRGDFPSMGAIGWKAVIGTWKFMCGSTLISSNFVLTAAHCSQASERDTTIEDIVPKIIRLGDKNILDEASSGIPPTDIEIIKIIVHPNYKSPKQYFDIALMKLKSKVKFSMDVQPACLWTKPKLMTYSRKAEVVGWGVVESGSTEISPELRAAEVDLIDSVYCDSLFRLSCNRNFCGLKDHQLCAGKLTGGVDACQGDSGGPLLVKIPLPVTTQGSMHFVIGVTSFGIGCGLPGLPGVYTRVSSFIDWIENIVWHGQ